MDLKLDTTTWDLFLDETGDVVLIDGVEAIAQHIRIRLLFIKGEWFLDTREGVPYLDEIWGQPIDEDRLSSIFSQVILNTPGVLTLPSISVTFEPSTRTAAVVFVADTDQGRLDSRDYPPFIVELS